MTEYMLNNKFNDPFNKVQFGVSLGEQNQLNEFSKILRGGSRMVEIDIASVYGLMNERGGSAASIGKTEREAISNLASINDVDLSIHAPWAINFSGINPENGEKDEVYENQVSHEISAAVQFADDIGAKMGRKNMPIIFHASSDNLGNPDKNLSVSVYDNAENKAGPLKEREFDMSLDEFKKIYGDDRDLMTRLRDKGIKEEDGKVILPPLANFEFIKKRIEYDLAEREGNIDFQKRNLQIEKTEALANEAAAAGAHNIAALQSAKDKLNTIEQREKDLAVREAELRHERDVAKKEGRYVLFDDKAADFAAKGIAKAAMDSFRTKSQPMILVENPMNPNMSLSNPKDTAVAVRKAREEFASNLMKNEHMSKGGAKEMAEQLIGINLDIGHVNTFKSFKNEKGEYYSDKEIVQMAMAAKDYLKRYHLNDNMGDIDAHLPLGEGNAPVKEIYERLVNAGVEVPAIMEVFGGLGGIEAGAIESLQYMGAPIYGNVPYVSMPAYLGQPYSSMIGDYSSYSNLGLKHDFFPYGGFSGISPIPGVGYMEKGNKEGGFSGAPMV